MIAAVAAGADGLEVEVHYDPRHAWSDGAQCLTPDAFCTGHGKVPSGRMGHRAGYVR